MAPASTATCAAPATTTEVTMLHQTIEKLHALKLAAMADGLLAQTRQPDIDALGFEDRLALLVDLQHTAVQNAALGQRLKASRLRQTACLEDLDLRTPRGLDRTLIQTLASCQWLRTPRSVLVLGPTGVDLPGLCPWPPSGPARVLGPVPPPAAPARRSRHRPGGRATSAAVRPAGAHPAADPRRLGAGPAHGRAAPRPDGGDR